MQFLFGLQEKKTENPEEKMSLLQSTALGDNHNQSSSVSSLFYSQKRDQE